MLERFLASMRERIELLSSYEGYLKEQMRLLVSETRDLELDIISAMKADGELNEALAMNLASVAGEQLQSGFDIHVLHYCSEIKKLIDLLRLPLLRQPFFLLLRPQ